MEERTHSFGYWLRRRRRALDLTQSELAASVACSHFAIRKIEADERRPSKALAERLARRLGIGDDERSDFLAAARGLRVDRLDVGSQPLDDHSPRSSPAAWAVPPDVPASPFVGRLAELAALDDAIGQSHGGAGQVALLAGAAGIGKTRTAQEAAAHATARGMTVLWARSPEEPGAPPYWPWIQLVRGFAERHDRATLDAALGAGARWISDIVPDLAGPGSRPAATATTAEPDAAQARFRLFDAIATFWRHAARAQGIVIVWDDVHWADASSLRLLEFVAAEARTARLALLATYRDTEVDRRHPLSHTVSELARLPNCRRVPLAGLDMRETLELASLFGSGSGAGPQPAIARLYEQTEGNPLYVSEMARFLATPDGQGGAARRLPAGIHAAIGSRLNRLSPRCNEVLVNAAVIGRHFELPVLLSMNDGLSGEACEHALEEAFQAGIIEETAEAGVYRFSHALVRETLYDEIPAIRRPRLHHRAALALEADGPADVAGQCSRLAHHFSASLPAYGAEQAVEYNRRAGEQSMALLAYEHAVERFHAALEALSIVERRAAPRPLARCDLLIRQGEAQNAAADYAAARESLRAAADLAMALDSSAHLARAAIGFEDASWRPGLPGDESIALLRTALERFGERDSGLSASVLAALTRALIFTGATDEAVETSRRAVTAARRSGEPRVLVRALTSGLSARWLPERFEERLQAATEAVAIAKQEDDRIGMLDAWPWRLFDLMEQGVDDDFLRELRALVQLADEVRRPFDIYTAASFQPALALMSGALDASEAHARSLLALGERQPGLDAGGIYATQLFTLRREQARLGELAPLVKHFVATTAATQRWRPGLALVFAELGMTDEARREFDALAADDFGAVPRDGLWAASIAYLAEVCALLGERSRAPRLYALLAPYENRNLVVGTAVACFGAASRFLGLLAATEGRVDDALRHFRQAIAFNERQGARTWVAHSRFQCALVLRSLGGARDLEEADALLALAFDGARASGLAALEARIEAARARR